MPGGGGVQRGYSRSPGSVPGASGYGQNGKKVVPDGAQQGQGGQQGGHTRRNRKGGYAGGGGGGRSAEQNGAATPVVVEEEKAPVTPGEDGALDAVAKTMRNLNKLKAIEELKEKAKHGERLKAMQLQKMEGDAEIKKGLAFLGSS
ncbi:hypothetical protein BDQ17DRAFT_1434322 [Cyathus striatus]|nr:hypothetical protein BDQ17DRAFT_1434322 [Cyathus striatus]